MKQKDASNICCLLFKWLVSGKERSSSLNWLYEVLVHSQCVSCSRWQSELTGGPAWKISNFLLWTGTATKHILATWSSQTLKTVLSCGNPEQLYCSIQSRRLLWQKCNFTTGATGQSLLWSAPTKHWNNIWYSHFLNFNFVSFPKSYWLQ